MLMEMKHHVIFYQLVSSLLKTILPDLDLAYDLEIDLDI
jgi:hypothetical protein